MVKIDMLETPYGPVSSKLNFARLSELAIPKIGIQTGPFGSQLHQDEYVDDGTPIITVEHLGENRIIHENLPRVSDDDKKRLNKYIINKGDIVFSRVGSVDRRSLVREKEDGWMFSGRCLRVRVDPNILDPTYLSYFFGIEGFKKYIRAVAVGATMPSINTQILSELPIYYPSLQIQLKISVLLSAFDDKIELNRQMNRTLEQMARALFKSWFIDFDPVHAKQRGEQPAGMDSETAALFPDRFVEIDGKEVPEGWTWQPFDTDLVLLGGGTPKTTNEEFWGGTIPWYSVVDVPNEGDIWVTQTQKTITEAGLNGSSTKLLPKGTTIISARGTVGKLALTAGPMTMNQSCYGLYPDDGKSINFTYFSTLAAVDDLKKRTHGAVFDTITRDTLHSINSVRASADVLELFEIECGALTRLILNNVRESAELAALRDSLLPRLLSGELDVSDWENAVEAPEGTLA